MVQSNPYFKQYLGETKRRLKGRFNELRKPVDNPSNISKPTTVSEHFLTNDPAPLTTSHLFHQNSLNPIELEKHTSSREAKLLNTQVFIRKMNVVHSLFILLVFIHLYYFYISNFFHITTSTLFVFIHFQRSLFPYFNFHVLLFMNSSRMKAVPSEILVTKNIYFRL